MLDRILADASDRACATMVLPEERPVGTKPGSDETPSETLERRVAAESVRAGISADELTTRIRALTDIRQPLLRMRAELTELRQRETQRAGDARRFDEQLELARQIQDDLLPELPDDLGPLNVDTLYLAADRVSGDIYDVARLDHDRFSFSIADATGHGMPAALLTVLIRNALRGTDGADTARHIVEPDALLRRLNRELITVNLTHCQFITGLHAVFDRTRQQIRWARAGIPYPILIRPDAPPRLLVSEGGLLGAIEDQHYAMVTHDFQPGDTLLFYTDGLEALLASRKSDGTPAELIASKWIDRFATEGPEATLAAIRDHALTLPDTTWHKDDVTVLALSMD